MEPGFRAVAFHQLTHRLWGSGHRRLAQIFHAINVRSTGADIEPGAELSRTVKIPHANGIVIGYSAQVGENVLLLHGVTLGVRSVDKVASGQRVHPRLEDNVVVYAGAVLLGPITVGTGAVIAANAVVLSDVPPYSLVVGVPGRVVKTLPKGTLDTNHVALKPHP